MPTKHQLEQRKRNEAKAKVHTNGKGQTAEPTAGKGPLIQALRGFKDILPSETKYWAFVTRVLDDIVLENNFLRIEIPMVERVDLYRRSVGEETDIVRKEMFAFTDHDHNVVSLRPEATAGIVRSYIQHGFKTYPKPLKLFTVGPMFRYDRPQAGRLREFHQCDFEIIGAKRGIVDAQLMKIGWEILSRLGLKNISLMVNSVGCPVCRPQFEKSLTEFFRAKVRRLSPESRTRLAKNPLRILDSKDERDQEIAKEAPQIVDYLCEECNDHLKKTLEFLDEFEVPYTLTTHLVRGLDYYTRTVFEYVTGGDERAQNALGGGGRYDALVERLGGESTPALGFALGLERVIVKMHDDGVEVPPPPKPEVYLAQLGELAKKMSLKLYQELHAAGLRVTESFGKNSIRAQLKHSDRVGALLTVILGQKEALEGTIIIRNMIDGVQEIVNVRDVVAEVQKRLEAIRHTNHGGNEMRAKLPDEEPEEG
ncbi:MAG: histidine--tRNA ligase [Parcubacteria group bacterium]|nr:histidine--tRNA ligase [Parcubacteria group bacterium]